VCSSDLIRIKPAPLLGFLAGHTRPADGLGIVEDSGLDGFVLARFHK
jgi:hypothetical protein